jgi:hypothetical protein
MMAGGRPIISGMSSIQTSTDHPARLPHSLTPTLGYTPATR